MKFFYFSLLFFFSITIHSQNNLSEQQYKSLQDKLRLLTSSNIDSAFIVASIIEKSNNYIHKAFANGAKSYLYQINGDSIQSSNNYKIAFEYLKKVPTCFEKTKNTAYLYNYGGMTDWARGNLNEALIKYQLGEKFSLQVNDIIQLVKFNTNIALINGEIGNYKLAIKKIKSSDKLIDQNINFYESDQFKLNKSNIYLNLGKFYEYNHRYNDSLNKKLIDSAIYFYNKAILYSSDIIGNKIKAQNNLANVYQAKKMYRDAEKILQNVVVVSEEKNLKGDYNIGLYNLGDFYFWQKKHEKALFYFKKVDAIYLSDKSNLIDYINSNYYQSKIYEKSGDFESSVKHATIYLDNFEKNQEKMNSEMQNINNNQATSETRKAMLLIKDKYSNQILYKKLFEFLFFAVFITLVILFFRNRNEKRKVEKKFNLIIEEYKAIQNQVVQTNKNTKEIISDEIINKSTNNIVNIDEVKEQEIITKLKTIQEKLLFLNQDFTLQFVAKKIKTNTTYLSYVVNKNFGKTFSEYSNELKINYAINQMISNPTYRKYSTLAIAESVGFKNATSFTRSFSKRTGLSPVQFAQKLDNHNNIIDPAV